MRATVNDRIIGCIVAISAGCAEIMFRLFLHSFDFIPCFHMSPLRVSHDWFSCPSECVGYVYNDINEGMDALL